MSFMDSMRFFNVIRDDGDILSATPSDTLSGKIFVGKAKRFQVGEIPVLGVRSNISLACGESTDILYGYNPQDYRVTAIDLSNQTPGNIAPDNVLEGLICWSNGNKITGTMANNGTTNKTLTSGESYTIPIGYHNGLGRISVTALSEQTPGTALASDVLIGKIFWVNGKEVAGTMTKNIPSAISIAASGEYTIPEGYHLGTGKVTAASLSSQTSATAIAENIAFGKTAWVNGVQITGTIVSNAAQTINLPLNGKYMIPTGIHSGLGSVTQRIDTLDGITITPSFVEQTILVKNKYMTKDITVTGISAFNVQNTYGKNIGGTSTDLSAAGGKEIMRVPTDNWHDAFTFNVYNIEITPELDGIPFFSSSCVNLIYDSIIQSPADNYRKAQIYASRDNLSRVEIILSIDPVTYEHIFRIEWIMDNAALSIMDAVYVHITDGPRFRRYGDAHDTDN